MIFVNDEYDILKLKCICNSFNWRIKRYCRHSLISWPGAKIYHYYTFSKRQTDLKQNGSQKEHHFLAKFSIPFHMVWSVLLRELAKKTFWPVEIFWQPIRRIYSMVFEADTWNKMKHMMWKGIENVYIFLYNVEICHSRRWL